MDRNEMIEKILAQEKKDMDKMSKEDVLGIWADYTDPDDDEYDMVESMTTPEIIEAYLFAYRSGLEGNDEEELEDRIFNWESYDKPNYKRMMTESVVEEPDWIPDGDGRAIGQQDFAINLSPLHAESSDLDKYRSALVALHEALYDAVDGKPMTEADIEGLEASHPIIVDAVMRVSSAESDWKNLTEDERIQLLHDAGYPEVSGDSYTVAYAVHSKDTGEEIDDGEITVMASSPMEAKNEAMRMLEEGGLDDEEYELHTPRKEAESRFDKLSKEIAEEYEEKGKSPEEAERIGDATAAMIGRKKYGKKGMMKMQKKGMSAETLAEIEGPTAEATAGGLHSPSSFTIGWEDEAGYSSASLPPNEIAWAEDVKGSESFITGSILAIGLGIVGVIAANKFGRKKKSDTASDDTKKAEKGCGCAKNVKKSPSVKESEYSVNQINPVEVEGQNDIHNAESVKLPSPYSGPQTAHRQNNRPRRNLW